MNLKFVVSHLDQQLGPFNEAELKAKWAKGELFPIDYVYDEIKKDWILLAERFDWAGGRGESAPPPLKPAVEKKKSPPAPPAAALSPAAPAALMTQQKALETTVIIQAPVLNFPEIKPSLSVDDPMPTAAPPAAPSPRSQPSKVTLVNGIGEISLSPEKPGQMEFKLTDALGTNLKLQEPFKIQVRSLEPEALEWTFPDQPSVGQDLEVLVTAVDASGGVCPHFQGDCSVIVRGSETRRHQIRLVDGQGSVKIANTKAEKWELSLEYSGAKPLKTPMNKHADWQPGPAARLILDGPADLVAGQPMKVQVRAVDQYGNLAKTFSGTVVLEVKAS